MQWTCLYLLTLEPIRFATSGSQGVAAYLRLAGTVGALGRSAVFG